MSQPYQFSFSSSSSSFGGSSSAGAFEYVSKNEAVSVVSFWSPVNSPQSTILTVTNGLS